MKMVIAFAAVVVLTFGGIVIMRESGRRSPSSPSASAPTQGKTATISHGEAVRLDEHLRDGVWTVVEFTADW